MSPLRRWFKEHHLPSWYSWLVVVGMSSASIGLSVILSINMTERAVQAERDARLAAARGSEDMRRATCFVVASMDDAYSDPATPITSPVGRQVAQAWHNLRLLLKCEGK
jgi:hypothetical protein